MTLTLNSPITEEQWDAVTDVDFDNTEEIYFHTKHGKEVCFVKRKTGKWIPEAEDWRNQIVWVKCSECGFDASTTYNFCPNCGADMKGELNER